MKLREYISRDKDLIIRLNSESISEVEVEGLPNSFADLDDVESNYLVDGTFVVAEIDNELVGMSGIRLVGSGIARINRMRVNPNHQRKGVAREILKWLEEWAKENSIEKILLNTLKVQIKAQCLYESHDYIRVGEGKPDGFEVVMYEKYL